MSHKIPAYIYLCKVFNPKVRYTLLSKYTSIKPYSMPDFIYKGKVYYNPVQLVMEQLGGVWKMPILWRLQFNTLRYSELRRDIPHISDKMLTSQLRELEEDGYISRKVYAVVPPKTEYSLTEKGQGSIDLITRIREYGQSLMKEVEG